MYTVNECAKYKHIQYELDDYVQAAAAGLVHFYIVVLHALMPKIVKLNDNVLSYTCV